MESVGESLRSPSATCRPVTNSYESARTATLPRSAWCVSVSTPKSVSTSNCDRHPRSQPAGLTLKRMSRPPLSRRPPNCADYRRNLPCRTVFSLGNSALRRLDELPLVPVPAQREEQWRLTRLRIEERLLGR